MRKLLTFLLLGIFLINLSSAFEFDNDISDYNTENEVITFKNGCILGVCVGDVIGQVQLKTPKDFKVSAGYGYVWEMDSWVYEDYNDFLKGFEFEDMNNGKEKVNRNIDIKIFKGIVNISVDTYGCLEESILENETTICSNYGINGSKLVEEEVWTKVTPADIEKADGRVTLRGYTNVEVGDKIDWSPLIFGVRVSHDIWATWTASLNVGLVSYYKLDDNLTTTNVIDSLGLNNATLIGGDTTQAVSRTGLINLSLDLFGTDDAITTGITTLPTTQTINLWFKRGTKDSEDRIISSKWGAGSGRWALRLEDGTFNLQAYVGSDATWRDIAIVDTDWHMVSLVITSTEYSVYLDNVLQIDGQSTTYTNDITGTVFFGAFDIPSRYFDGELDEAGIWNRTLIQSEVTQLFNNGNGITYTDVFGLSVILNQPENNTIQNDATVDFNWTIIPRGLGLNITNWTLTVNYENGSLAHQHINTTINTNETITVIHNDTLFLDESYIWNVESCGNDGICDTSTNWTFTLDTLPPVVNITHPPEGFIVNTPQQNITLNYTVFHPEGDLSNCFYNTTSNSTTINISCIANTTSFLYPVTNPENLTIYVFANDTGSNIGSDNVTIYKDVESPQINATSPIGIIDFGVVGKNETLNVTFTDAGLNSCWYNYNGTNISIDGCLSGIENSTNFILEYDNFNMTIYANDSLGNFNSTFIEWEYKILEINQTYNSETTEGGLETFLATIKLGTGYSITEAVLFNYNSSSEIGQSFVTGINITLRKANFLIPNVEVDTNASFYWSVTLSDSTQINLTEKNQTIFKLDLDNCSSFTNELLNFTVVDEESQILLPNATIEIAVNIFDRDRDEIILNFSNIYQKINPLSICLNRNISTNVFYSLDTVIRYEEILRANEYYNIVNFSLTNETETQMIILYDLNLTDSTEFQLSFTGADFLPVENALVNVDRQYISENIFKTVELPKTDYNGQSVLHLVRNDVVYNIRISKNGVVLGNFENLVAFCQDFTIGDCNIELNAFDSVEDVFDYDSDLGIIFNEPEYNETQNLVSFNFLTSDGTAKEVVLAVTRNDIFGNRSICNSSLISSGGTLTCSIDPNIDESTLNTLVYVNGILTVRSSLDLDSDNYGEAGWLISFVIALSFVLLFSGSKEGVLISIILSSATTIGLGLNNGNMVGLGASGLWLIVVVTIGIYKLKKDVQQ